jgi:hypothetical protein
VNLEYFDEDGYSVTSLPLMEHMLAIAKWRVASVSATNLAAGSIEVAVREPKDWQLQTQNEKTKKTKDAVTALREELTDSGYAIAYRQINDVNVKYP